MKKLFFSLVSAILLIGVFAFSQKENKPSFVKEFTVSGPTTLNISTSGGYINTEGGSSNKVEVAFIVKKKNEVQNVTLQQLIEMMDVTIQQNGNSVEISVKNKNKLEQNMSVSFEVKAPKKTSLNLFTSGGGIQAANLEGTHAIKTSGGALNLEKLNGKVEAHTSGGSINLGNSSGEIKAHTSGGPIKVTDVKGTLDLHTSGGSISLTGVAGSVVAKTNGGSINADLNELKDKLVLSTSGGSINATIPAGLGMDLNLKGSRVDAKLTNFSGEASKNKVKGKVNGGGVLVDLTTSGGTVNLNYN